MAITIFAGKWTVLGVFAIKAVTVMALIALVAVATPHIAKAIDKHRKPEQNVKAENSKDAANGEADVHGIFEASRDEDFDPNYKIYNTDIYGFGKSERNDNKNGKE